MNDSQANNKKIAKNTLFLFARMLFGMAVSLYTSRVLLNVLGVVDLGIQSVIGGFVLMFGFLNNTLSSSMQRFYNTEGAYNGELGYSKVLSMGVVIHAIIALLYFVVLETFGLWYVNKVMVIPDGRLFIANILYQSTILSSLFMFIQIPYSGIVMAKERMDYYAYVGIFDVTARLAMVLALPHMQADKLLSYSIFSLFISIINFLLYLVYCRREFPDIKFTKTKDKSLFVSLMSFSGWNLMGTFGFMMKSQGLNLLLNFFFGPVINAARSIAYQINTAVSNFYYNVVTAFRPQLTEAYANGDTQRTRMLMYAETKLCFLLMATLSVPVIYDIDALLRIWLGPSVPGYTNVFAILILLDMLVNCTNTPCTQVIHATGKMRNYQIASTIINLSLLPFSWLLLHKGFEAPSVYFCMIVISVIHQIVSLHLTNKEFQFGMKSYFEEVLLPLIGFFCLIQVAPLIITHTFSPSLARLFLDAMAVAISALLFGFFVVLSSKERSFTRQVLMSKIKKK